MFKGMNVLVWFVFLLNNCLYVYVMFVVIDFLYCNLINVIGWFYIMCLFELLINCFFDKLSYLNNRFYLNIIKMINENELLYLK